MFSTMIDQLLAGHDCKKVFSSLDTDKYIIRDMMVTINKAPNGRIMSANIAPITSKS